MADLVKRGYENGARIIEIIEGNLDLVLYNNRCTSFYFYRFDPEEILGQKFSNTQTIINQKEIKRMLERNGKLDYDSFMNELISVAVENNMRERYEM